MKNNELIYDWLDFLAEQKSAPKSLIKESRVGNYVSSRDLATVERLGISNLDFESGEGDSIILGNNWQQNNISSDALENGETIRFHKDYIDRLKQAFKKACEATRNSSSGYYCPTIKGGGGFVPRRKRNSTQYSKPAEERQLSNHSWGTAIDIDPANNPRGTPSGEIRNHPEFIETMKNGGFIWGGDWSGNDVDDMHFEVDVGASPSISSGVSSTISPKSSNDQEALLAAYDFIKSIKSGGKEVFKESLDRKIFKINDESEKQLYTKYQKYFDGLLTTLQKRLKLTKPVDITNL